MASHFHLFLLAVLLALSGCAGPGSMSLNRLPVMIPGLHKVQIERQPPFLIVYGPSQGSGYTSGTWGRISHPEIFEMSDQRIMLNYHVMGDTARSEGVAPAGWPALTKDGGKSWTVGENPILWADGVPNNLTTHFIKGERVVKNSHGFGFGVVTTSDGVRIGYQKNPKVGGWDDHSSWGWGERISSRDGVTWYGPDRVRFFASTNISTIYLCPKGVVDQNGDIFQLAYGLVTSEAIGGRVWSSFIYRSRDGGWNYDYVSMVGTPSFVPWADEGSNEGALVMLSNGDLLAMTRTGAQGGSGMSHDMLLARSSDKGLTWQRERMKYNGVMPKLLQMSNGVLVACYGRPGSFMMFSVDEGRTWGGKLRMNPESVKTSGYIDAVEVEPGRLLVIFDMMDVRVRKEWGVTDASRINGIFGAFMDVTNLVDKENP